MQSFWGPSPGLQNRLKQLTLMVEQMAALAKSRYGRGLDLAILPETAVSGEANGSALAHSLPFDGEIKEAFARTAREHNCYIVVPSYLLESEAKSACS